VSASPSASAGSAFVTGSSHVIFPASTRVASIIVVIDLVIEPIMNSVLGVTGSFFPSSRTPKPFS
jgi:urea transporter